MSDLIVGLGLVLVIEGLVWALSPRSAVNMLAAVAGARERTLRLTGTAAVAIGVGIVWWIRG